MAVVVVGAVVAGAATVGEGSACGGGGPLSASAMHGVAAVGFCPGAQTAVGTYRDTVLHGFLTVERSPVVHVGSAFRTWVGRLASGAATTTSAAHATTHAAVVTRVP